jgi:hypothetical protein
MTKENRNDDVIVIDPTNPDDWEKVVKLFKERKQ